MRVRFVLPTMFVAVFAVAGLATFVLGDSPKLSPGRPADNVYNQTGEEIAQKQRDFLRRFMSSGRDVASLPRFDLGSWASGAASLSETKRLANAVVVGRVVSTGYGPDPNGGEVPISDAQVAVDQVVIGPAPSSLHVLQRGGPMESANGVVLAQLDLDELLVPGETVVLFLQAAPDGTNRVVPGGGKYRIVEGRVRPSEHNVFGSSVDGLAVPLFLNMILSR